MKDRIAKLLTVKSLVTLALAGVFCFMSVVGKVSEQTFVSIFASVIAFYFGVQTTKKSE